MLRILLLGLIASSVEVLGGTLVVLRKEWPRKIQEYLIALSAGFILALVFFDLIPESIEKLGASASLYIVIGFSLLHFFEHTIVGHLHFGEETLVTAKKRAGKQRSRKGQNPKSKIKNPKREPSITKLRAMT